MTRLLKLASALSLPLALAACKVGPNYAGPPRDAVPAHPAFARAGQAAQGPALARWWEALGDARLSALIDEALARNPGIEEAQARIREAAAILRQRQVTGLPSFSPNAMIAHAGLPGGTGLGNSITGYNLGANASWEPDLWGANARATEAARATLDQRQASLADTQVALSAQVAQAYVNLRSAQAQLAMTERLVALQGRALDLTRQRQAAGTQTLQDVERAKGDWLTAQAQVAPLKAQAEVALNQLAVLTGRAPGDLDGALGQGAALPVVPAQVAVGDPATLIAHRPDIRVAERALAASTAQVGVAQAKMFPSISFMGILGLGGTSPDDMIDPSKLLTLAMPQVKWSGLDWGRTQAGIRQSKAERDVSEAQYRRAVLSALEDAESSLSRFGSARVRLAHLLAGEDAARASEALGAQRLAAGTASGLEQIQRQGATLQAGITATQARADLLVNYIAVNKALGLGWS